MKRIGLLTSGGDCQALNATMRGVVKGLANNLDELEVYGFEVIAPVTDGNTDMTALALFGIVATRLVSICTNSFLSSIHLQIGYIVYTLCIYKVI